MTAGTYGPRICCLDLDTFFVSVERVLDPSLEGRPVIVGGRPGTRGVVTAASYEVRRSGVHSGMSLTRAAALAPDAVYLPGRRGEYSEYSRRVVEIVQRFSPVVRTASIDEMFIDFRGLERLYCSPDDASADHTIERTVRRLAETIRDELGLPASAGIATTRTVAKIASGLAKPAGVLLVPRGHEPRMLAPLPVRKFPGIGKVAAQELSRRQIHTLGDLMQVSRTTLDDVFGAWAGHVASGLRGEGRADLGRDRPAFFEHDRDGDSVGSISNERTFFVDEGDESIIAAMLCSLAERVAWRARKRGVKARTIGLKLRYADFTTLTRSRTISPTDAEPDVLHAVTELYTQAKSRPLPVRLLGVSLSNLTPADQLDLFPQRAQLHNAVDVLRARYGFDAVRLASGRPTKQASQSDRPPTRRPGRRPE
ncbi:MAG: DNA polymerase IV [Myxococcales bacterium FL481]|nr:MAG: DNA polymerase IV [Myxococcales bacterium FL481]